MSLSVWKLIEKGFFGPTTRRKLTEYGCSKWMGKPFSTISKIRNRTYEGNVLKIPCFTSNFIPGLTLSVSKEYLFDGVINKPHYWVDFDEIKIEMEMYGAKFLINAREYETEEKKTYATEIEFLGNSSFEQITQVTSEILKMTETDKSMKMYVDQSFMSQSRHADHDVLDVSDVKTCTGIFTYKADGMKVYVFSYRTGYIITFTDRALTIIDYHIEPSTEVPEDITKTPDIMVAEMMLDGSLIYIDTLALNGEALEKSRNYVERPVQTLNYRPPPPCSELTYVFIWMMVSDDYDFNHNTINWEGSNPNTFVHLWSIMDRLKQSLEDMGLHWIVGERSYTGYYMDTGLTGPMDEKMYIPEVEPLPYIDEMDDEIFSLTYTEQTEEFCSYLDFYTSVKNTITSSECTLDDAYLAIQMRELERIWNSPET